jgi:hypothetical protein
MDFPNTPTLGQIANGYNWDGQKWNVGATFSGPPFDFHNVPSVGMVNYDVYVWDGEKWNADDFYDGAPVGSGVGPFGLLFLTMAMRDDIITPPPDDDEPGPVGLLLLTMGVR